jgi:hypothetical protein
VCPHAAECIGLIETQLDIESAFPIAFFDFFLKGGFYLAFDPLIGKASYRMTFYDCLLYIHHSFHRLLFLWETFLRQVLMFGVSLLLMWV